jgi:hypothetical protein
LKLADVINEKLGKSNHKMVLNHLKWRFKINQSL